MRIALFVALGGAIGAVARHFASGGMTKLFGRSFPFGTLTVNVVGSFLIGIVLVALPSGASPQWRAAIAVGFLGALTTFSTFALETVDRIEQGQIGVAIINVLANVAVCLVAVWGGLSIARWLTSDG